MTGVCEVIAKIGQSGFNSLQVIDFKLKNFEDFFGFTKEEVKNLIKTIGN
jgi:hypothetical protein